MPGVAHPLRHTIATKPRHGIATVANWSGILSQIIQHSAAISTSGSFRDAIQVGHATGVTVAGNVARRIGFPAAIVDVENYGFPAAIDTAGDVDHSLYENNQLEEINGKCIDLDGFHDGVVRGNTCTNRGKPEDYPFGNYGILFNNANKDMRSQNVHVTGNHLDGMKYGAVFVIGIGHQITGNTFTRLNTAHCPEA